jgi:hypothetical protein
MKNLAWLLPVCLLAAGCAGPKNKYTAPGSNTAGSAAASKKQPADKVVMSPTVSSIGRVLSVFSNGRFVVLTFPIGTVPAIGQRMDIYRQGLKVGEVKISGPQNEENTVADITTGDVRIGDETRGS